MACSCKASLSARTANCEGAWISRSRKCNQSSWPSGSCGSKLAFNQSCSTAPCTSSSSVELSCTASRWRIRKACCVGAPAHDAMLVQASTSSWKCRDSRRPATDSHSASRASITTSPFSGFRMFPPRRGRGVALSESERWGSCGSTNFTGRRRAGRTCIQPPRPVVSRVQQRWPPSETRKTVSLRFRHSLICACCSSGSGCQSPLRHTKSRISSMGPEGMHRDSHTLARRLAWDCQNIPPSLRRDSRRTRAP
mmetsp:Transcript_97642/g.271684  ORF Transcript_97642/g.271684 Transcript_97642/m.271684 type:complete len:252 (+) Transcript_97642:1422-2177(+)